MQTKNNIVIRGFVGRFIKDPKDHGDPAKFDVLTVERVRASNRSRETVTKKDWHTIKTWDFELLRRIHPGACVEIDGRLDTRMIGKNGDSVRLVEIIAERINILLTQKERDLLRDMEDM